MSKVSIRLGTLTSIGDAVRAKKGTAEQIPVANLASEIESIQTGTDTSKDTVTAETMLEGVTAHDASGEPIAGTIPTYDGAMQDGLESYPKFQEKTATENGEVLPDEGFDGLSKVMVNVPSTGGGKKAPFVYTSEHFAKLMEQVEQGYTPPTLESWFVQVSSEEFTVQELEKSIIYLYDANGDSFGMIAPQSYYETHFENIDSLPEKLTIMTLAMEGDIVAICLENDAVFAYLSKDIVEDGVVVVPKGLYFSSMVGALLRFIAIINY